MRFASPRAMVSLRWSVLSICVLAVATTARAQAVPPAPAAPNTSPAGGVRDARTLFAAGAFSEASAAFADAYAKTRDPRDLWNLAACEAKLAHWSKTRSALRDYAASPAVGGADRNEATSVVEELRPLVSTLALTVNEAGTDVILDGDSLGVTPLAPFEVDVGTHGLLVRKTGFQEDTQRFDVESGKDLKIDVRLRKADEPWFSPLVGQRPLLDDWHMDRGFSLHLSGGVGAPRASGGLTPSAPKAGGGNVSPLAVGVIGVAALAAAYRLLHPKASGDHVGASAGPPSSPSVDPAPADRVVDDPRAAVHLRALDTLR
jgi:PEGA domain-containing protein